MYLYNVSIHIHGLLGDLKSGFICQKTLCCQRHLYRSLTRCFTLTFWGKVDYKKLRKKRFFVEPKIVVKNPLLHVISRVLETSRFFKKMYYNQTEKMNYEYLLLLKEWKDSWSKEKHLLPRPVVSSDRLDWVSHLSDICSLISVTHTHTHLSEHSHTKTITDMNCLGERQYPSGSGPVLSDPLSSMAFHSWFIHSCLTSAVSAAC